MYIVDFSYILFFIHYSKLQCHLSALLFGKNKKVLLKPVARSYKKAVHFEIQN